MSYTVRKFASLLVKDNIDEAGKAFSFLVRERIANRFAEERIVRARLMIGEPIEEGKEKVRKEEAKENDKKRRKVGGDESKGVKPMKQKEYDKNTTENNRKMLQKDDEC